MKTYTFTFTEEEINLVLHALQELPARVANPLTKKIHEHAQSQMEQPKAE